MWYNTIHGRLATIDRSIDILSHADPDLSQFMQYDAHTDPVDCPSRTVTRSRTALLSTKMVGQFGLVSVLPSLMISQYHSQLRQMSRSTREVIEVVCEGVRKPEAYVNGMSSGDTVNTQSTLINHFQVILPSLPTTICLEFVW